MAKEKKVDSIGIVYTNSEHRHCKRCGEYLGDVDRFDWRFNQSKRYCEDCWDWIEERDGGMIFFVVVVVFLVLGVVAGLSMKGCFV